MKERLNPEFDGILKSIREDVNADDVNVFFVLIGRRNGEALEFVTGTSADDLSEDETKLFISHLMEQTKELAFSVISALLLGNYYTRSGQSLN